MVFKKYINTFVFFAIVMNTVMPATQHHPDNPLVGNGAGQTWEDAQDAELARLAHGLGIGVGALTVAQREPIVNEITRRRQAVHRNIENADAALVGEMELWARIKPLIHPKTIGAAVLATAGIYGAYRGGKVFFDHIKSKLEKPPFIEDTNDEGFMTSLINYFLGTGNVSRAPKKRKVVINESHRKAVERMSAGIRNAIEFNLPSRNYLFYGPPGTGKTMLARQLAYLSGLQYYIVKASTFTEKDGARNFRMMMRRIRNSDSRAIVFVDEAEQLLRHRTQLGKHAREVFSLVLDELGDSNNRCATFIFSTNLPDDVDKAMQDRLELVEFVLPDTEARKQIITNDLHFYFKKDARSEEAQLDISDITENDIAVAAQKTEGMSGRALSLMIEKLQQDLIYDGLSHCTQKYFAEMIDAVVAKHKRDKTNITATRNQY